MQKTLIIGNVGKKPVLSYTPQKLAVAKFSVAVSEKVKSETVTTWFNVTAFGQKAEFIGNHVDSGAQIYIDGKISIREWTGKDQVKRMSVDVVANDVQLLGSRQTPVVKQVDKAPAMGLDPFENTLGDVPF